MKPLLSLTLVTLLLCGCPDTKIPKVPPKVPEPKAPVSMLHSPPGTPEAPGHGK